MSKHKIVLGATVLAAALAAGALAQQARGPSASKAPATKEADAADLVKRMMAFDKNADGKLTKEEISDDRLLNLFARADADKDGSVTPAELTKLAEAEHSDHPDFDFGPPPGGPGGRRGPRPPGGPGGGPPPPAPPR
ncbi:EF-hand domain-containing protein [Paludisphaera rhizosphaerae]|uniref:hypothetical protein n=1 Tax=Paludisphaera rhizosphaerae TaxID=2711216 RepID=UPI001F111DD0|nr:hypothetical protein [Paludisphaera rhizosphaerae]